MNAFRLLLVATVALAVCPAGTLGGDPKFQPTVILRSGYSPDGIAAFGEKRATRSVKLSLEGPADGGKGQLVLDPNEHSFNKFGRAIGGTKLAFAVYEVTLKYQEQDGNDGPKSYELQTTLLDQKLELVVPKKADGVYKLMIRAKGKQPTVVILEAE
jgi:hypothetical protein